MNQDPIHPRPAKRGFHLVHGGGLGDQRKKEAERLDRFLADADPILVAPPPEPERPGGRHWEKRGWIWALFLLIGLSILLSLAGRSGLRLPAARPAGNAAVDHEKASLLLEEGRQLLGEERADRDDEALAKIREAVRLAPDVADAWADLGTCYLRNYQSELGERSYLRALALDPGNQRALQGLGNLYIRLGDYRQAEEVLSRGGLDRSLARLYLLQGRFGEARARLATLLAQSPDDELLYRMAQAARSERLDTELRCLLEPEPAGQSSWAELGWRLYKRKQYDAAAGAFRQALSRVPGDVNAMSGLGTSLLALDRSAEAKPYFERALTLDRDHVRSLDGLAYCLKAEGRVGEAIALWERLSQLYPYGQYGTPEGLAWTYYEIRDYRQAAVYFARLVKRYPYDSRMLDALNVAVQNLGMTPAPPTR